jgi:hypothetical protein
MLGRKTIYSMDEQSYSQAHYTVLQSSTLAAPYIMEHMNMVRSLNPRHSESRLNMDAWRL